MRVKLFAAGIEPANVGSAGCLPGPVGPTLARRRP
jgi:hypothetical protein